MNRRDILKSVGLIVGGTIVGGQAFLVGCKPDTKTDGILDTDQIALLDDLGEVILPKTAGSPGAKEAKVGAFMNNIVTDYYTPAEQQVFLQGIADLKLVEFSSLPKEEKVSYVEGLEAEAKENPETVYTDEKGEATETANAYIMMKQLTIWGFLASEVVAKNGFNYLPIPAKYDTCVEVTAGVKPMYGNPSPGQALGLVKRSLDLS
ncbi:gluconate 2-dehydrogenase subunit 3 family protein [Flammeovirgaceae bacterium SG7u.111]|nr:gluconate 2-dehydrogenase subunit 3 family protein [Flammeovirgaceae bacterium SG7u.132]WPO37035.1 gluconate 2-dehydrogenase subunit 3 family protein [Flammeovirgaceae bacterium SG7u.111]